MANEIQELLNSIEDGRLRSRLSSAISELKKTKKFGLVFEEHLPELLPLYSAKIRIGTRVARKEKSLTDAFIVQRVSKGNVVVQPEKGGKDQVISIDDLVVVKRFGEAIFPVLRPIESVRRGSDSPHHALIEADNYHALQLLQWLYPEKVDCIYIDPPYNTGARDWKYNNDFVDNNDSYRHSKWLAMMERRLKIAIKLLKYDGVLILTIDDNELSHLDCLLEKIMTGWTRYIVCIEHNKRGRRGKNFAKSNEFALFYVRDGLNEISEELTVENIGGESRNLRRTGSGSLRKERYRKFYPIYVDAEALTVLEIGEHLPLEQKRFSKVPPEIAKKYPKKKVEIVWPVDEEGREKNWHYAAPRAKKSVLENKLEVRPQSYGLQIYYTLRVKDSKKYKTVWTGSHLDASTHGTELLEKILGNRSAFDFPKSLYGTAECLRAATRNKPNALILDFFAGSGTTLHATLLLNAADEGTRRCILVTNNEVFPEDTAIQLKSKGIHEGSAEFEKHGICQAVTYPRSKFVINGKRDNGAILAGEYLTGKYEEQEVKRSFINLDFVNTELLLSSPTSKRKSSRQSLAQVIDFPRSKVTGEESFFLAEEAAVAALLEQGELDQFIEEGAEYADSIEKIFVLSDSAKSYNAIKERITDAWPPLSRSIELKRPMEVGFNANLEYFRLDFLDRDIVETTAKMSDLLPSLWMMAGSRGKIPSCKGNEKILMGKDCPFAVLIDETKIKEFLEKLQLRRDISWVFLVTNDQDNFARMSEKLPEHIPANQCIHLWRDYIDNFLINIDLPVGYEV
jgi:adenine-specific DNA-methyltransferase